MLPSRQPPRISITYLSPHPASHDLDHVLFGRNSRKAITQLYCYAIINFTNFGFPHAYHFFAFSFTFFLLFHIHDIFFTIPPQICEPELGCCVLYTSFLLCGYFFLSLHFPFDASISVVLDLYSVNFDECNVRKH